MFGSLHPWTPPKLLVFCRIIRKCSLKVIACSYPGNTDRLVQLTNGVGMDTYFYPLRFHFAHTETRGIYGDNKSIFFKKLRTMFIKNPLKICPSLSFHLVE